MKPENSDKGTVPDFAGMPSGKNGNAGSRIVICMVLIGIILAVYWQVGNYDFVGFDDGIYVTANPHISRGLTGDNIIWAFTSVDEGTGYWLPVTWLSHMADVQFYGMNPRGHHLTSVFIHTVSTLLLLFLLLRWTGTLWPSAFVAALFALHPMHVESVAWVAERKDVLSAFFWFLTLLMYCEFATKRKPVLYILALFSFMLGLMSKPMLVTLPVVMLLMDFWPLNRLESEGPEQGLRQLSLRLPALVKEKIPFFACSLLSGIVTVYAQHKSGAVISVTTVPLLLRFENAMISYAKYIGLTIWPHDLAILYPFPLHIPFWQVAGSLILVLLASLAAILARRRYPYFASGWFWFLITLLPVIGLIQVGTQSMADRFSYIPSIGLFIAIAWGVSDLAERLRHRKVILAVLAGAIIIASATQTRQQLAYWEDSFTLFRHTLQVTSGKYIIHNNLGVVLDEKASQDEAIEEFREALRLKFDYAEAHYNLGVALYKKGDLDEAIKEFQTALQIKPNYVEAHHNLGLALAGKGKQDEAIREYHEALRINPNYFIVHNKLGILLAGKGDQDGAVMEFREALRINPNYEDARKNLEGVLAHKRITGVPGR
jgi:tetratricopeptide (TPR) repeat protein